MRVLINVWNKSGTLVSSTNKTDRRDITEILLKVALNTKIQIQIQCDKLQYLIANNNITSVWFVIRFIKEIVPFYSFYPEFFLHN